MSNEISETAKYTAASIQRLLNQMTSAVIQSHLSCLLEKQDAVDVLKLLNCSDIGDISITESSKDLLDESNIPIGSEIYVINTQPVEVTLALTNSHIVQV